MNVRTGSKTAKCAQHGIDDLTVWPDSRVITGLKVLRVGTGAGMLCIRTQNLPTSLNAGSESITLRGQGDARGDSGMSYTIRLEFVGKQGRSFIGMEVPMNPRWVTSAMC
jgi:hypothetical protein